MRAAPRAELRGALAATTTAGAMTPRQRRFGWIAAGLAVLGVAVALVLNAFQRTSCSSSRRRRCSRTRRRKGRTFRIGGLVGDGSAQARPSTLTVRFVVTDTAQTVPVVYTGLLPDLFKEGKGVVAQGTLGADGVFLATEVLAKHDENYMPPEAADAIEGRRAKAMTMTQLQRTTR